MTADSASNSDNVRQTEVSCPAGKQVVGGGGHVVNAAGNVALDESYPASSTKWRATAYEINATAGELAPPGLCDLRHRLRPRTTTPIRADVGAAQAAPTFVFGAA